MARARWLVDRLLYVLSGLMLTVILVSVALEVGVRVFLQTSLPWSGELATMGLVWMSLLAGSYAIAQKANIRIDTLARLFPDRVKAWLEFSTNVVLLGLFAGLFFVGLRYTITIAPARTGALVVSQAYFYSAVPVSALFMLFYTASSLWESLSGRGGDLSIGRPTA